LKLGHSIQVKILQSKMENLTKVIKIQKDELEKEKDKN
jgi:hypothetical protein